MFVGQPSDQQRRMFDHMKAVQEVAFAALRPGALCSDVDRAVRAYYEQHDLMPYWKHHSGHAIGLRYVDSLGKPATAPAYVDDISLLTSTQRAALFRCADHTHGARHLTTV